MRIYDERSSHLFCGHWNGSPVEIGEGRVMEVPSGEVRHNHPVSESGCRWVLIKERSEPDSKTVHPDTPLSRHRDRGTGHPR
jgi:hypothetical protein